MSLPTAAASSKVPMRDDREDLEALLATATREKARILYVSNPNNPMGSWWPAAEIGRLIARLPDGMLLVLDEAYSDTAPAGTLPPLDVANPQVIRYRTFSKAYGLAGARIGYALGSAGVIEAFDKVRNHYGINRVGQLGALAALHDQAYLAEAVQQIARARDKIAGIARDNGLSPLPSATNFVAIDCGADGAFAKAVLDGVLAQGVFIRKPAIAPLDRCIRVSCGKDEDLALFADALPKSARRSAGASPCRPMTSEHRRGLDQSAAASLDGRDRILSLAAVIMAAFGVGISFGIAFPLTSLTLESWGTAKWQIGIAGAAPSLSVLLALPFVPRLVARLGLVPAISLGCLGGASAFSRLVSFLRRPRGSSSDFS